MADVIHICLIYPESFVDSVRVVLLFVLLRVCLLTGLFLGAVKASCISHRLRPSVYFGPQSCRGQIQFAGPAAVLYVNTPQAVEAALGCNPAGIAERAMDHQIHRVTSPVLAHPSERAHPQQQTDLRKQNLQCTLALAY